MKHRLIFDGREGIVERLDPVAHGKRKLARAAADARCLFV
jgi:hypothetical protein